MVLYPVGLVSDASGAIGLAICRELVERGMCVSAFAPDVEELIKLYKELVEANSPGLLFWYKCDMSNEEDVFYNVLDMYNKYKSIDVLCINNAVCLSNSSLVEGDTAAWRKMIQVNVLAVCTFMRLAQTMRAGGQIILMGGITAHEILSLEEEPNTPTAKLNFYRGTVSMIRALTEGFRQELKPRGIRVSTISIGSVETGLLAGATGEAAAAKYFEARKCLKPEDVVSAVMYIIFKPIHVDVRDIIIEPRDSEVGLRWNCSLI